MQTSSRIPAERSAPLPGAESTRCRGFVYFDHRAHIRANVACQQCHGPVETMERVRQVSDLSMGWCVNCHRAVNKTGVAGVHVNASINCSACHF